MYDEFRSYTELMQTPHKIVAHPFNDGWLVYRVLLNELVPYNYTRWTEATTFTGIGPRSGAAVPDYVQVSVSGAELELLYHEDKLMMYEVFHDWNDPWIEVWWNFPADIMRGTLRPEIGTPDVSASDETSFGRLIYGYESPYNRPTGRGRFFLPYKQKVRFAVFNPASYSVTPKNHWYINKLIIKPFRPHIKEEAQIIHDVLKRRLTKDVTLWGPGTEGWRMDNFRDVFGVDPVIWVDQNLMYQTAESETRPLGEPLRERA